jgi:hypothetical protein
LKPAEVDPERHDMDGFPMVNLDIVTEECRTEMSESHGPKEIHLQGVGMGTLKHVSDHKNSGCKTAMMTCIYSKKCLN